MTVAPRIDPVRTTCPYCGVGCGVVVDPAGAVVGDTAHPANAGRLCSKGAALGETLDLGGRLLHPEIDGRRASWNQALDLIAETFTNTIAEHGPQSVALYASGQFLTEDYYVANKLMKGFVGAANIDTNSRLCMASSVAGHVRAFGEDVVPGCYEDIEEADLVILVGSNAAWCHPVLFQRLAAAKTAQGTRVVVIDPRRTATCDLADLHLALKPGTDVALFNGLLVYLAERGVVESAWVGHHTAGFEAALDAARLSAPSLAEVAAITDLPCDDVQTFYDWFAATERTVTLYSQGVNQSSAGTDKVNALVNGHLATGRIGKIGMGPFSLTGQPNAMGGREVGGLANQLAAHMSFADPADIDRVRRFWNAPRLATQPGLKAVDLFDAVLDGRIKALWVMATNPAVSMPRAGRVRAALEACPFVVSADCWSTDTTEFARVRLPAAGWAEKDGTVTNSERRISRQRAFRPMPGEARPDWWMLTQVARCMGFTEAFPYESPAQIFREHAALSAFENGGRRAFDIGGLADLSDGEYDRLAPVQWPIPKGAREGRSRLFTDGAFSGPDRRARFVATPYRALAAALDARRPLLLNTGRVRDQWHTMTRTGGVPRLMMHVGEPFLDVHPDDAATLALTDGDLSRIESEHGAAVMRVRVAPGQRRGEVFAAMHWTDQFASTGPIDRLVGAAVDPVSGQPELKATPVSLMPLKTAWRGLLIGRTAEPIADKGFYWSRIAVPVGSAYELAGWRPLTPDGEPPPAAWVSRLLGAPLNAEFIVYADPGRGDFRYASLVEGRLEACLFLGGPEAALPSRESLLASFDDAVAPYRRTSVLAGVQPGGSADSAAGRIICACFAVGLQTIQNAIRDDGLESAEDIGAALRAGTNCGSCVPELKQILWDCSEPAHA